MTYLIIHVDDSELDDILSRLNDSMDRKKKIEKEADGLDSRTMALLNRLPMLREARMLTSEVEAASALSGVSGVLGVGATLLMLGVAVNSISNRVKQIEENIISSRGNLEDMVREGMDLTHEEYTDLNKDQIGYANEFDEFMSKWNSGEYWDAIADYVIAKYPWLFPERPPMIPSTIPPEVIESWRIDINQILSDILNDWRRSLFDEDTDHSYDANLFGGGGPP